MTKTQETKLKKALIKLLKEKGTYNEATDNTLIDSILFNIKLIEDAKTDIQSRGSMVNLRKEGETPFFQINFSISIFHNAVKSINTLLKQLGLEKEKKEADTTSDAIEQLNLLLKS